MVIEYDGHCARAVVDFNFVSSYGISGNAARSCHEFITAQTPQDLMEDGGECSERESVDGVVENKAGGGVGME